MDGVQDASGHVSAAAGDGHLDRSDHEPGLQPRDELDAFETSELGAKYPSTVKAFRDARERFTPDHD